LQGEEKEAANLFRQLLRQSVRTGLLEATAEEVEALFGRRYRPDPDSPYHRAGSETGVSYMNGGGEEILRPKSTPPRETQSVVGHQSPIASIQKQPERSAQQACQLSWQPLLQLPVNEAGTKNPETVPEKIQDIDPIKPIAKAELRRLHRNRKGTHEHGGPPKTDQTGNHQGGSKQHGSVQQGPGVMRVSFDPQRDIPTIRKLANRLKFLARLGFGD
jgi:hypothetical protein